jgi:predicted CXXCH cytochrome family protein
VQGETWNVFVRTDLNLPSDFRMAARIENGKIMCSTCHDVHNQTLTPFDPDAPITPGEEGRHYQRVDNDVNQMCADCHSARDVTSATGGSHPVGVAIPGTSDFDQTPTAPLDASNNVACLTCHQIHFAPTSNGTLARDADTTALCEDCHLLADPNASHMDAGTGVLWPGGQYGTTFPENTDTGERGACTNCHQPHGWPDTGTPTQDYARLLVEDASAGICFTCHDSDGPAGANIHGAFTDTNCTTAPWGDCTVTGYQAQSLSNAQINQRHDVTSADQTYSGGTVACANCHNPHLATSTEKVVDPSVPTTPYTTTYDFNNHGGGKDPMNPIGCTGQAASVGPAVEGVHNGDDLGTSGGTFTDNEDQLYTVTISTGGAPGTAEITVTSLLGDDSGPTTVTAFNTPVDVGNRGVTISFTDGGSGGTPSSVGPANCVANCEAQWVGTSGGTYSGPANGTYSLEVTTTGSPGNAILTCTSSIAGDACNPSTTYVWAGDGTPFSIGSYGVTIAIADNQGQANLNTLGTTWDIAVTAAAGDSVLTAGDTWTIAATAATAGCSTADEPDMVTFYVVCHDTGGGGSPPGVPGVTMSTSLLDIGAAYPTDRHGQLLTGNTSGNGFMKAPWQDVPGTDDGSGTGTTAGDGFADQELTSPTYAAMQCDSCHDGHGSPNIFHLKTSINVRGIQLSVGGGPGSGFEGVDIGGGVLRFTTVSDYGPGDTTYQLPCFSGNSQVSCGDPGAEQRDHGWGAFCTFCHDMQTHGQSEDNDSCRTGHMHGGGAF